MKDLPLLATRDDLVRDLGIPRSTLSDWTTAGKLPVVGTYYPPNRGGIDLFSVDTALALRDIRKRPKNRRS